MIAGEDAELIRGLLGLAVGYAGYGRHSGNAAAGLFQLNDRFHDKAFCLPTTSQP